MSDIQVEFLAARSALESAETKVNQLDKLLREAREVYDAVKKLHAEKQALYAQACGFDEHFVKYIRQFGEL